MPSRITLRPPSPGRGARSSILKARPQPSAHGETATCPSGSCWIAGMWLSICWTSRHGRSTSLNSYGRMRRGCRSIAQNLPVLQHACRLPAPRSVRLVGARGVRRARVHPVKLDAGALALKTCVSRGESAAASVMLPPLLPPPSFAGGHRLCPWRNAKRVLLRSRADKATAKQNTMASERFRPTGGPNGTTGFARGAPRDMRRPWGLPLRIV